jgi:hypothetical protein
MTPISILPHRSFHAEPVYIHFSIRPAGVTVTASQVFEFVFFKKVQKAVGPPEESQTVPPVIVEFGVHGSPRGPNVIAVAVVSVGVTGVVDGNS